MSNVGRRQFLTFAGAALIAPRGVRAQTPGRVYRIGMLSIWQRDDEYWKNFEVWRQALRERGWIEGKNIAFEFRFMELKPERLPDLARELVALKVDLICTSGNGAVLAAMKATQTIPIVANGVNDPVKFGIAQTLARPGGNVTGITWEAGPMADTKSFELLKQAVPSARRIAILGVPDEGRPRIYFEVLPPVAKALGVELLLFEAGTPEAIEGALTRISESRAEALFVPGYSHFYAHRARIAELALKYRLPMGGPAAGFADAGGLIGHSGDLSYRVRRVADLVDKILRGAKPGELPFEQPTRFELVVNLKTAKALGITVPPEIRLRADRVIE